jgi:hypothetical protein
MRWNPVINGLGAAAYIGVIALVLQYIGTIRHDTPDTLLDPMAAISLLVFSVAVMGFLFFYQPAIMLLDGKKQEAVAYFFKTLGTFGVITALFVLFLLFGIQK